MCASASDRRNRQNMNLNHIGTKDAVHNSANTAWTNGVEEALSSVKDQAFFKRFSMTPLKMYTCNVKYASLDILRSN